MKRTRHAMNRGKLALVRREEIARAIDLLRWWAEGEHLERTSKALCSVDAQIQHSTTCADRLAQDLSKGGL